MGEEPPDTYQQLWERYMEVEHRELEQRQNRQLGRALPDESQEELDRIVCPGKARDRALYRPPFTPDFPP